MASPFPGMNPYLEQEDVWHDFHERFIPHVATLLGPQVRPAYIVKLDEHVYIHEFSRQESLFIGRGDVTVARSAGRDEQQRAATVADAPVYGRVPMAVDTERHSFIEIRDRRNRELVTVIELLSPANKRTGPDRELYLSKRRHLLASNVHLVEIDLLRGDPRLPVEGLPACDYCILVNRVAERPNVGIWPIGLPDQLPRFSIPLREPHADAWLDLQQALRDVYDAAGYADYIYVGKP